MDDAFPEVAGYRFEAKLAEGGMGVVYRAVDDTLGRTVAIKMIRGALLGKGDEEEETVARFLREARAAAQIRSNHVAHVLQFGRTASGDLFLVLEYLDGKTLTDVLRKEKRVSPERAVHITRQICRGMEAAHQLGIVHRDLKPSNVMLVDQDGDPEFVKILDFGVAKVVGERESGVTRAGMLVGTYTCMAPEQVVNETIDARTDVYALAVMLFRLLTGKPLFDGNDVTAVLYHHVHTQAPSPSKVAPDAGIPAALDAIVLRCLEKQPNRRVRSMADLDRALGLSLELGAPVEKVLEQAPTNVTGPDDETRTSYASREPTAEAEVEDEEVFAESGPIRSTQLGDPIEPSPQAATQITDSGALLPSSLIDPPTPGTSTSSRAPVSVGPRTGEPVISLIADEERAAPSRSRAPIAALAGVVLLLGVIGAVALASAGDDAPDDVVVVVKPGMATSEESPIARATPAGAVDLSANTAPTGAAPARQDAGPGDSASLAAADEDDDRDDDDGRAARAAAGTDEPGAVEKDDGTYRVPRHVRVDASGDKPAAGKERAGERSREQKRRRAARRKVDGEKGPAKSTDAVASDTKGAPAAKSRFIRVRTGDSDD